ncbi:MAG: phosphotriesterase-related protein [Anaerolineae bacterium]|nr:phosphotriesterase-related protein [Anaerolineae bacterium]
MAIIRTVLGDIAPDALGICYPHEHVYGQPPAQFAEPDLTLDDEALAIDEMRAYREAGGGAIVEMTTPDYNRDAAAEQRIARASGVHIIGATGYNKEKFSAPFLEGASVDQLAARFIAEVREGMDGTDARAGVIKGSSTLNQISPLAEKLFLAAAQAHHATHAPISTHTEAGTMALEQVAILTEAGVAPEHIIIGHVDRKLERDYHLELAATGVTMSYDQIGKAKYYPDAERADVIAAMIDAGHGHQIVLAADTARRSYLLRNGGPGFVHILRNFIPLLRERGVAQAAIADLLIHNPARVLAFDPA